MLNEVKKILHRKEFYFTFFVLFFAVIGEFIYKCYMFREVELSGGISAHETFILYNITQNPLENVFSLILPILISVAAATIAYEEKKSNLLGTIYTRTSKKKYIMNQFKAVFITAFGVVTVCLLISLLLSLVAFPIQGHFSYDLPHYEALFEKETDVIWRLLMFHPYIKILMMIILRSLLAGGYACFAYGISYFISNKIAIIIVPLIFSILHELVSYAIRIVSGLDICSRIMGYYNSVREIIAVVVVCLILMTIGIIGVNKGIKVRDEL